MGHAESSALERVHPSEAELELLARAGVTLESFERWVMDYGPEAAEEKALELLRELWKLKFPNQR